MDSKDQKVNSINCGVGYMSFFGHLENIEQPDVAPIPHLWVTVIIGVGWLLAILGLVASLRTGVMEEPSRPNNPLNRTRADNPRAS